MHRLALIALIASFSGHAAPIDNSESPRRAVRPAPHADETPARSCVDVEVNGTRVRDYDCLSQLLVPDDESTRPPAQLPGSEAIATRHPSALGMFNREATRQRMGNTFGKSTMPQRPPAKPPTLPPAIRRPQP